MAASDKNNKGKRTDYARHYSFINGASPACGTKGFGYSTNDINDVDCEKCMIWLLNQSIRIGLKQKSK